MGTFIGHIAPGAGFMFLGFWHLLNILRDYVQSPWSFQSKTYYPARLPGKLKYMELYLLMFGTCLSISAELFICPAAHQPFADDWSIPSAHLNNFEHSTISLFFLIHALLNIFAEVSGVHVPRGVLHVMGAFALSQELMLFHFHSADHMGVEGHYHWLLQIPILVGILCLLVEIAASQVFVVALVRSLSIIFQGWWLIQMGLTLWIPSLVPKGCAMRSEDDHDIVRCATSDADHRAKALANLEFSWSFAVILIFTMFTYWGIAHYYNKHANYEPLDQIMSMKEGQFENLKDVETGGSQRSSHDGSSQCAVEMQGLSSINLER